MARPEPRSRRQTRGAILEHLLRKRGAFRPELAEHTALTDASVSRIIAELRQDGFVQEERRSAPYVGGPTSFITLSNDYGVIGVELSNSRLSVGVGRLDGSVLLAWRQDVPADLDQETFEQLCRREIANAEAEAARRGLKPVQAAVSLPGYGGPAHRRNPIFRWDLARLNGCLREIFGPVPFELTNSVIAQAAFDRYATGLDPVEVDHLFVFVGHGVAGAIVSATAPLDAFSPVEMGHAIVQRGGAPCRCGHHGCLEAYTSLRAIAPLVGLGEARMLALGDGWLDAVEQTSRLRAQLRDRLVLLGVGIGNVLNLHAARAVVVSGWPSLLGPEERAEIARGIDESLLGGFSGDDVSLEFRRPVTGNDPGAAIAFAACAFARNGGTHDATLDRSAA